MITFQCPACNKVLKVHDESAGKKAPCPRCGQRLMIPPPSQSRNRTTLGKPLPNSGIAPAINPTDAETCGPVIPPGKIAVGCPGCGRSILLPPNEMTWQIECARCNTRFVPAGTPLPPSVAEHEAAMIENNFPPPHRQGSLGTAGSASASPQYDREPDTVPRFVTGKKHSGLGIASFLIAVLVGGLDVIMAIVIATNIAKSGPHHQYFGDTTELSANMMAGGISMVCLNLMSIPLCLVGAGLGLVGLIANRDQEHIFTWLGLLGNEVVILGVVGLYLFGAMVGN